MNIYNYCQQKAAPVGSSTYYAFQRAPLTAQPLLTALYALHQKLAESISDASDPAVGHVKFTWWQSELSALAQDIPTHPATQAIASLIPACPPIGTFMTWLSGYQMDLNRVRYIDFLELQHYLEKVGATLANTIARVTACDLSTLASGGTEIRASYCLQVLLSALARTLDVAASTYPSMRCSNLV
ncbi:squalene/phytoene synthase family protein [Candidatus Vallotiella sp. (ex Adelges kitamiensis)]|uniref:squalene/phytoene synthase family protein n=1 Tax=Candidatus Vallotiella sp. (ex Adelges kitamiensis) TaxID=2864217 RepID=UPI002107834F|nr:squalene/phytoene synthase family protein [Candidatus Vallotia sp. (ex Adelges kitamiensis)]